MTLRTNNLNCTYQSGKQTSDELIELVVNCLLDGSADITMGTVSRGLFTLCSRTYHLTKPTVSTIWKQYFFNGHTGSGTIPTQRRPRKLSDEDHLFIKQLVTLDPTIYKYEICEKLFEYSNTPPQGISIPTLSWTVRYRLGLLPWTRKRVQRSNRDRWLYGNILYTRNFMDHVSTLDVYSLRYVDEAGFNINSSLRHYGSSEIGSHALKVSKHHVGPNYTLFLMVGLNNKIFAYVSEGPSDSNTYIEFITQALDSNDKNGEPVLYPGCCIVSDRAPIHGRRSMDILGPSLEERDIEYYYLPPFSPDLNATEQAFACIKHLMKTSEFQTLLEYHVPTAIYQAMSYMTPGLMYKLFKDVSYNFMNL